MEIVLKNAINSNKGFSLVEIMIASAIMLVTIAGGYKAYEYFSNQTSKEAKKLDQVSEFTALTRDLMSFTEGAGISTFYLNLPIKVSGCSVDGPCVKQLDGEKFIDPASLPSNLSSLSCIQFYKDAKGYLEYKPAYPGKPQYKDKIWENKTIEIGTTENLYTTWTIKDPSSPPYMMIKSRDASVFLKQIRGDAQVSRTNEGNHSGLKHSFFVSDSNISVIKELTGYPFLIYNTTYPNQYMIQEAEEIISCSERRSDCLSFLRKIIPNIEDNNTKIKGGLGILEFPNKVFAIKFKPLDFQNPFFSEIVTRQNLPSNCKDQWGDGRQEAGGYFFPSKAFSVSPDPSEPNHELNQIPINTLYIGKYAYSRDILNSVAYVALPIDIITFKAEETQTQGIYQLISQMWHPIEIKKRVKIHKLTAPITFSRKLGSQEFGVWYNPIKKD